MILSFLDQNNMRGEGEEAMESETGGNVG